MGEAHEEGELEPTELKASVEVELDQVEAQVEIPEPTSIQAPPEGPFMASLLENSSELGECSSSFPESVFDSNSCMPEASSPIVDSQGLVSQTHCLGLVTMVSDLQLALLEDLFSEEPVRPLSCTPLNTMASIAPPPLRLSCEEEVMNNPSRWVS